jgi:hypothetical protein
VFCNRQRLLRCRLPDTYRDRARLQKNTAQRHRKAN